MKTDEASLTGESAPVNKSTLHLPEQTPLNDRRNLVFTGTVVVYGQRQSSSYFNRYEYGIWENR